MGEFMKNETSADARPCDVLLDVFLAPRPQEMIFDLSKSDDFVVFGGEEDNRPFWQKLNEKKR